MIIGALLPAASANRLKRLIPRHELKLAASWKELRSLIDEGIDVGVFDPTVNGSSNIAEAAGVFEKYSSASLVAYVTPTPQNLAAVFKLSKCGLQHVFVHDVLSADKGLLNAIERVACNRMAVDLLANIESKLANLPPRSCEALTDLFARPQRYENAVDLAYEAEIPMKQLYREFANAGLRSPKQLVVFAKAIHAYGYLRFSCCPEPVVCKKLGYSDRQCFLRHVDAVFGRTPKDLRNSPSADEALISLIEWMYKPQALGPILGRPTRKKAVKGRS